jgi:hypothetical protein
MQQTNPGSPSSESVHELFIPQVCVLMHEHCKTSTTSLHSLELLQCVLMYEHCKISTTSLHSLELLHCVFLHEHCKTSTTSLHSPELLQLRNHQVCHSRYIALPLIPRGDHGMLQGPQAGVTLTVIDEAIIVSG